jgi:hypothetical protein
MAASIYLYIRKKRPEKEVLRGVAKLVRVLKDFTFDWVLLGLLIFYVYSVGVGSYFLFAAGNVVVEILLIAYVVNVSKSSQVSEP